jgi:hypothetical protein
MWGSRILREWWAVSKEVVGTRSRLWKAQWILTPASMAFQIRCNASKQMTRRSRDATDGQSGDRSTAQLHHQRLRITHCFCATLENVDDGRDQRFTSWRSRPLQEYRERVLRMRIYTCAMIGDVGRWDGDTAGRSPMRVLGRRLSWHTYIVSNHTGDGEGIRG